jgi:hypothetical protein
MVSGFNPINTKGMNRLPGKRDVSSETEPSFVELRFILAIVPGGALVRHPVSDIRCHLRQVSQENRAAPYGSRN